MNVHLVVSHRHPGRYAFNVLVGALESVEDEGRFRIHVARNRTQLLNAVKEAQADGDDAVVCAAWSFYSPSLPECAAELTWLRTEVTRPFLALAGGVHATSEPLETLQAGFDRVMVGEGEHSFGAFIRALRDGGDVDRVAGVARLVDGRVAMDARAPMVANLDQFPAFSVRHWLYGAIEVTRGCIYACSFCQTPFVQKARFRHRSVGNIVHWASAIRRAGLRDVRFISPTAFSYGTQDETPNLPAVEELLGRLREAVGAEGRLYFGTFPSEVRPEHVTPEALRILKRYVDNRGLILGGQSGSDRVLKWSHRGHSVEAIERAARVAVEEGFEPSVDFILGLPGEEPDDVAATVALMERLTAVGARVHGHTFMPLPGTPFKNAPAGRVDPAARKRLQVLEGHGQLHGQWKQQEVVAADLAQRRDRLHPRGGRTPKPPQP